MSYLRALNTCGMRQQSAIDISSPTQYLPAHADNSFSTAGQRIHTYQCFKLLLNPLTLAWQDINKTTFEYTRTQVSCFGMQGHVMHLS